MSRSVRRAVRRITSTVMGRERPGASRLAQCRELFRPELLRQVPREVEQISVHDRIDLVQGEIDAMVGHASLRKVVGAYTLAAIAAADQALARRPLFSLALLAL